MQVRAAAWPRSHEETKGGRPAEVNSFASPSGSENEEAGKVFGSEIKTNEGAKRFMSTAATGRAKAKTPQSVHVQPERYTNGLWTFAYLAVTFAVIALGNIPADRQQAFVNTLSGVAGETDQSKPVDLKIKQTGRGYIATDGKYELHLVPIGNVATTKTVKFIEALRGNIKATAQNTG